MSSWIEDGRLIVSSREAAAAAEAIRVQTDQSNEELAHIAKNETARQKALKELAEVGEKFGVLELLENIFAEHWHLGRVMKPPADSMFGLTFDYYDLDKEIIFMEYDEPIVRQVHNSDWAESTEKIYGHETWSGRYNIKPSSSSIIINWHRADEKSGDYLEVCGGILREVPFKRHRWNLPDHYSDGLTKKQLKAALSEICFNREGEHSWPEQLQGAADAQIVKAVDEGALNLEGVDLRIIEEVHTRHQARIENSPPMSEFWKMMSSGKR